MSITQISMDKIYQVHESLKNKQIKCAKELSDYLSNKSGGTLNSEDVHFLTFEMIKTDLNVSSLVEKITKIANKRQEIQEIIDFLDIVNFQKENQFKVKNIS